MKKAIFAVLLLLATTGRAGAQVDSCLQLVCIPGQPMGGDSGFCINPDSVMIDTCKSSTTYGEDYAFRWWEIDFAYYVINVPAAPPDTTLEMSWTEIDTSYHALRASFADLETKYGSLILKKVNPSYVDSTDAASKVYYMRFNNYVCIDSVISDLDNLPDVDTFRNGSHQVYFASPVGSNDSASASVRAGRADVRSNKILLNPNPVFSSLRIRTTDDSNIKLITIFDQSGKKVFEQTGIDTSEFQLDIRFLSNGIYFISSNQNSVKLVVQR
jgi:hypothetical protein